MKSKKVLIGVAVLLVVGAVSYFTMAKGTNNQLQTSTPTPTAVVEDKDVRVFDVTGKPFTFTPNEIRVKKGDRVRINFSNELGFHDLTIPGLSVKTAQIQAGKSDSFEFTADKAGTFEFLCSVPTHKDKGMVGTLIVEDDGQNQSQTQVSPTPTLQVSPVVTGVDNRRGADKPEN